MWARIAELVIGCWLALSPLIFGQPADARVTWVNDVVCAVIVIVLAALSFWPPAARAHLGSAVVGLWLIAFGYQAELPRAALENDVVAGWLLVMLAIVPTRSSLPPRRWLEFMRAKRRPG